MSRPNRNLGFVGVNSMYMAELTTTSSGEKVRSIRINCDTNLSPSEIERLQHLLETSRYHFSIERLFTAQTYDSGGGRLPIAFSNLRTTLLLKFSLTWTRTKRSAIKTVVNSVDKVILDSAHPNRRSKVIYDANGGVAIEIEETDTPRKQRETWTRKEKLAVGGLVLTVVSIICGVLNHEIRQRVRLEKPQPAQVELKPTSLAPQPAQTIQNPGPPRPEPSKPKRPRKPTQETTTHVTGNDNVAGNNIFGDHNVTGNSNQTGPTAIAPNGIAIAGPATVTNPTVNNFGKPSSSRHLTESQKMMLIASLKRIAPQSFYFLSAPDAESTHFGNEILHVLTSPELGWKVLDLPSNWGQAYRQREGLFIVVSDLQKPPQGTVELQQAFKGVGINASGITYPMVGADKFAVYVGVNPASE